MTWEEIVELYEEYKDYEQSQKGGKVIWKTRDGKVMTIEQMDNNHLRNTIRMLIKNVQETDKLIGEYYCSSIQPEGDMAKLAVENQLNAMEYESNRIWKYINAMQKELKRRADGTRGSSLQYAESN